MSPVEVDTNSNHGTLTVAPATSTMNRSTELNSNPNASSRNSEHGNDSANLNITSNANPSETRRFSLPAIPHTKRNNRKASQASASSAPASLESTSDRQRGQSVRGSFRQLCRSLQQSLKRRQKAKNEETSHDETSQDETSQDETSQDEIVVFSERFTLDLPIWVSADKSEIDYLRRTQMEGFLGITEESNLARLPPLANYEDEEELNWVDPTLDIDDVKPNANNTAKATPTPTVAKNKGKRKAPITQQPTMSGALQNSATSMSKDQEIYEANEISITIACFQEFTEINGESSSSNSNSNNAASGSRMNTMSHGLVQPLSYYRHPH